MFEKGTLIFIQIAGFLRKYPAEIQYKKKSNQRKSFECIKKDWSQKDVVAELVLLGEAGMTVQ